ncbi:MAG: DUF2452 domain-containing protein [Bacteroidota bacterium]
MSKKKIINPIDKDKITDNPGIIAFPHSIGSAVIKPEDQGKIKGRSVSAMEFQTDLQLNQIYEQMQLLANQAKILNDRKKISHFIYSAEIRFEPFVNHIYHLYKRENLTYSLSLVGPNYWGRTKQNLIFVATVRLLADHTWEIIEKNPEIEF